MVSFFGLTKEIIYGYALILLIVFFVLKKPNFEWLNKIKKIKLNSSKIKKENLPELFGIFILIFSLSLTAFFIPINQIVNYDDSSYHLPIINDIAVDGKKTFFVETKNIYEVRSNQFPLLFESFVGATKFFLGGSFFWCVSFFSLILSLFLIYCISKQAGCGDFFSMIIYCLSPIVLIFSRYFGVEGFISMFFLGAVFFILKFIDNQEKLFILIIAFLSGLMFLTKLTGGIFFAGFMLFFIYKKKYKEIIFSLIIFILISLVFFVSHINIPLEYASVGAYGEISVNPLIQFFSNAFRIGEIFFYYFLNNFYLFFVPFLFFLGLFWKKEKEKDFSALFLISLVLFLFVTFVSKAYPTLSGFPRYFLPIYALLSIFAGIQLKKIVLLKNKKISIFFGTLFVAVLLFTSFSVLNHFYVESIPKNYSYEGKNIENNSDTKVWFINGAALLLKIDDATAYDYAWKTNFSGNPCDFLKNNEINYIVYFHIDKDSPELGAFGSELRKSLLKEECSEVFAETNDSLNSVTFKIIHK